MVKELENDAASNAVPDYAPDDTDRRIIALLQEDGRMSTQDIARTQGAASSTIRKRIRRLEGTGTMRVVAVVDFAAAGYDELLAIGVEVESRNAEAVGQAPGHNANHVGATTWCAAGITCAAGAACTPGTGFAGRDRMRLVRPRPVQHREAMTLFLAEIAY